MAYVTRRRTRGSTRPRLVWGIMTGAAPPCDSSGLPLAGGPERRSGEVPSPLVLSSTWQHRTPLGQRSGWLTMRAKAIPGVWPLGAGAEIPHLQDTWQIQTPSTRVLEH
jgi:hypothetical protein